MEDKMEQEFETLETWYPWHGGGEMIEIPYNRQTEMPLCTEYDSSYSKLVATFDE
jgi:hypothetical protein|tara:strand:+ start:2515 stop:2679 length:165 start_codon:yes stop_codon:yes gene_type:complete